MRLTGMAGRWRRCPIGLLAAAALALTACGQQAATGNGEPAAATKPNGPAGGGLGAAGSGTASGTPSGGSDHTGGTGGGSGGTGNGSSGTGNGGTGSSGTGSGGTANTGAKPPAPARARILSFAVTRKPQCEVVASGSTPGQPAIDIRLSWSVAGADHVAFSDDEPDYYESHGERAGKRGIFPTTFTETIEFPCNGPEESTTHEYTINTMGSAPSRKMTITYTAPPVTPG